MRVLYISLIILFADQASKILVKGFSIPFLNIFYEGMYYGQRIPILGDFFRLTYIENPGMAFGFDPGLDFKLWISIFSLIASVGIVVYLYYVKDHGLVLRIALAFILGGALGNLIDRVFYGVVYGYAPLFYGKVVDFLDFDFFNFSIFGKSYDRWPIFNIADSAVTIGVIVLIFFYRKPHKIEIPDAKNDLPIETNIESIDASDSSNINPGKNNLKNDESDKGKELPH